MSGGNNVSVEFICDKRVYGFYYFYGEFLMSFLNRFCFFLRLSDLYLEYGRFILIVALILLSLW